MIFLKTTVFFLASLSLDLVDAARKCPTDKPQKQLEEDEAKFARVAPDMLFRVQGGDVGMELTRQTVEVPVHWHVISRDSTVGGGSLPDISINDTIEAMNTDYAATGFHFTLADVDRTVDSDWFKNVGYRKPAERQMKTKLRQGGSDHLNIYTVGFENKDSRGLLGYATFPDEYERSPTIDGVVMLHTTVVGGAAESYNLGGTLSHEVGHWLGLYHTFQGGCNGLGDMVDDTPAEKDDGNDSCERKDSCPGQPGLDPVTNYMTYSFDNCYAEFTPGQIDRMHAQWAAFRGASSL